VFQKITVGWVVQICNENGTCTGQTFHAGDTVEYRTLMGDPLELIELPLLGGEYHPFDMVQPD